MALDTRRAATLDDDRRHRRTTYGYDHRDRLETNATPLGTITYDYEDAS